MGEPDAGAWTANDGTPAAISASLNSCAPDGTWTTTPGTHENAPINCLTWYKAFAFCAWDGGWLPTEAEWEYAAKGGSDERTFPWGSTDFTVDGGVDPANYARTGNNPLIAVGSYPAGAGKWGHQDLAGGAWEWVMNGSTSLVQRAGRGRGLRQLRQSHVQSDLGPFSP